MLAAGGRALVHHRWLLASIYAAQVIVSVAIGGVVASALAAAFAQQPAFDRAVAGNPVALVTVLADQPGLFTALGWTIVAAALLWGMASWFLTGGLIGALLDSSTSPTATAAARRFGAAGATTLLSYARLAVLSAIPYAIVVGAIGAGVAGPLEDFTHAATLGEAISAVVLGALPGVVLGVFVRTAMDYARIDLALAGDGRRVAWRALLRAFKLVALRPVALAHALIGVSALLLVTGTYIALTWNAPFAGAAGAVGLFAIRQVVSALRFSTHVAVIAGQVRCVRS